MRNVSLRRGAVTLTAASVLDFVLQLLLPVMLVRLLPPAVFADYRLAWLAIGAAMAVAPLALPRSLYYFLPRLSTPARAACVQNTLLMLLASGAGAALLLGPWNSLLPDSLRDLDAGPWFLPAFVAIWVAASLAECLPGARGELGQQARLIVGLAALRVAVIGTAALWGRADIVFGALLAYAVFKLGLVLAYVWRHYGYSQVSASAPLPPLAPAASQPPAQVQRQAQLQPQLQLQLQRQVQPQAEPQSKVHPQSEPQSQVHPQAEPQSHVQPQPQSEPQPEPQSEPQPEPQAQAPDPSRAALARTQLVYALPFGLAAALFLLRGQADQWVAAAMFPATAFAAFSIGAVIMPVATLVRTSVSNAIAARLSALDAQCDRAGMLRLNQRANLAVGFVLLPSLVLIAVLAEHIVTVVYTPAFAAAAGVMRMNCLALLGVAVEVSTLTLVLGQGRFLLAVDAILLPVAIAAAMLGALLWGLPGAALGNTLTLAAGNAFSFWRVARVTGVPVRRLQRWEDLLRLLAAALAAAVPALLLDRAQLVRAAPAEAVLIGVLFALVYLGMLGPLGLWPEARSLFGRRLPPMTTSALRQPGP